MNIRVIKNFYHHNKYQIWKMVGLIIFILIIINILNRLAAGEKNQNIDNIQNSVTYKNNISSIYNPSQSLVSGDYIPQQQSNELENILKKFLDNCVNENPEEAYRQISSSCKEIYYPNYQVFLKNYYESIFKGSKIYTYQSWISTKNYIYIVKIMDNIMNTGKATEDVVQDYYTVVKENGEYKLNINNYINRKIIDKTVKINEDILITLNYEDLFMDYSTCSYTIVNKSSKNISLRGTNGKSIYLLDSNNVRHIALEDEIDNTDFIIKAGDKKKITIKYNNSYASSRSIQKRVFSQLILDYDKYLNSEDEREKYELEVEI